MVNINQIYIIIRGGINKYVRKVDFKVNPKTPKPHKHRNEWESVIKDDNKSCEDYSDPNYN